MNELMFHVEDFFVQLEWKPLDKLFLLIQLKQTKAKCTMSLNGTSAQKSNQLH